jgi:hypothetical protein
MNAFPRLAAPRSLLAGLVAVAAAWVAFSASPPAAGAATPSPFFGVSPATATSGSEMRHLAKGGIGTARFTLNWRVVQPRPNGPYNWLPIDYFVVTAARNGVIPLPKLIGSPSYVAHDPFTPPLHSASARHRWQTFVRAAVRRYGTTGPESLWTEVRNCDPGTLCDPDLPIRPIRAWQIWNEPNMKLFWKPVPNVGEYAQLLRLSTAAVRSIDPRGRIVVGGITPGGGKYGPDGSEFLAGLYQSTPDAAQLFDAVALHPYEEFPAEVVEEVEEIRGVMNAHGDTSGRIRVTEFGWGTGGPPGRLVVTQDEQADRIEEVASTLLRRRAHYGLESIMAYTDHDFNAQSNPSACEWCPYAGLMLSDGRPKPAWLRYSALALSANGSAPRLLSSVNSTEKVRSVGRGRSRKTGAQVTSTVERYSDRAVIVDSTTDDLRLTKGRWKLASCLRFLAGSRPGSGDHLVCDRQRLSIKSRRKSIAPGNHLMPLEGSEVTREPYGGRPRVIGYVEAQKRQKGRWRTKLTSLRKSSRWISLRDASKRR